VLMSFDIYYKILFEHVFRKILYKALIKYKLLSNLINFPGKHVAVYGFEWS